MRPTIVEYLMLVSCICVALICAIVVIGSAPPSKPYVRLSSSELAAPFSRGECRNHQYIVIETDAFGVEREIDEGQFCDINE